jgi:hypothetical protein
MLHAGKALRFTPQEVEGFRQVGLDFEGARTQDDIDEALDRWVRTLAGDRPDLLDKIAVAMTDALGVQLPPRLSVVAAAGCARQP